ncbi:hypothetical protein J3R82DRAFT_7529 [Butyriboletus roseoflavus]|nr:hypothetical protein J3R82DRAFT_7529 [Butyriboletus roseoflavus]
MVSEPTSSPFSTDPALSMSRREDVIEGRLLFCRLRDSGQFGVKAREVSFAQTDMGAGLQVQGHLADTSEKSPSASNCIAAQGYLDERLRAISEQQVVADDVSVDVQGICAVMTRTAIERPNNLGRTGKVDPVSVQRSLVHAAQKRAVLSGPTILDLAISTELESASSHSTENDRSHDTKTTSRETNGNDGVPFNTPPRRVSILSVSFPAQATLDGRLKRRHSSVGCPPKSKKKKLDRVVSHVSCASDPSVELKYQATEPASIRRARSLRSEVSACSGESTDSLVLFYPSPLSLPTFRPCPGQRLSTDGSKHPTPQFRGLCPIESKPFGSNGGSLSP